MNYIAFECTSFAYVKCY